MKYLGLPVLKSLLQKSHGCDMNYLGRAFFHCCQVTRQEASLGTSEPLVIVEHYNDITLLGLNRPSKRNALSSELITVLRHELDSFQANKSSYVALLYGTGGNFCAGLDLDEMSSEKPSIPIVDEFCSKPIIAAVNGYTVGEGFDLAMACDIRIMDDQAVLGSFNRRFGVPMSGSSLRRLSAIAGLGFTLDYILSGRPIYADEALQRGLVQQLAPCGSSKGNAITYAQSLCKYPQDALRADRAALLQTLTLSDEIQKAVEQEMLTSWPQALMKMQSECKRFSKGVGKHGSFKNLTVQGGWPEWMKS